MKTSTTPRPKRQPRGEGPLATERPTTGRPIEDPAVADAANPRWEGETPERPGAQSLANADGSSNVLPPKDPSIPMPPPEERSSGTPQDQAARPLEAEVGRDNIREGRGGGTPNPALAEGGDNG